MTSMSARTSPWLACMVFSSRTNEVNCTSETGFADSVLMTCCSLARVAVSRSWQATSSTMQSTPRTRCNALRSCSCNAVVSIQIIFTRVPVDIALTSCCHSLQPDSTNELISSIYCIQVRDRYIHAYILVRCSPISLHPAHVIPPSNVRVVGHQKQLKLPENNIC